MNDKVIFFKQRSNKGPFSCLNGEIESVVNARLIPVTTTVNDSTADSDSCVAPADLINPKEESEQLNRLSSKLLPIVEFSLKPDTVSSWHNHPDNSPSITVDAPKNKDAEGWAARAAYALDKFMKDASRQHLFVEPFFALCALRLTDGSHILPSSPVLLTPNVVTPTVESGDNFDVDSMSMTIPIKACRLSSRLTIPKGLTEWSKQFATSEKSKQQIRVAAIDIFISATIPLYRHTEPLLSVHRALGSALPQSWIPTALSDDEFTSHLLSVSTFRMVSTIPLESLNQTSYASQSASPSTASFFDVDFNVPDLPELKALSAYTPDFLQHQGISAKTGCRISGYTTLCDLTLTLPTVPPLASMMECKETSDSTQLTTVATEIEVIKNGETLHASYYNPQHPKVILSESVFPKWLFIPDPDARQLTLITSSATFVVPLRQHPLLNGSYYWSGKLGYTDLSTTGVKIFAPTLPTQLYTTSDSENSLRNSYRLPNAIWRSGKDRSAYFPDKSLMRLDVGRVIAICRAFRASGLVATTSPTAYLFTTQGIYLLKEMDNGDLRDAGLIANYILDTPDSISMSGRTLYFTTVSGNHMVISGTTIKPISTSDVNNFPELPSSSHITPISDKPLSVTITPINPDLPIEVVTRPLKLEGLISANFSSTSNHPTKISSTSNNPFLLSSKLSNPQLFSPPSRQILEEIRKLLWSIELRGAFTQEPNNNESLKISDKGSLSDESLKISLYGSTDLIRWKLLATSKGSILQGLYPPGLRYARLVISGTLNGSVEALTIT
ncbi:MAG: hypothetical protein K2J78_00540, partial [Muribaculaceae bacterium]|nr:hypothetical protein [Muribaculaceae bacterium]